MKLKLLIIAMIASNLQAIPSWADKYDLHVARVIAGESRGESKVGQALVADVIYTRMIKRKLNAYQVVKQKHQFKGYSENGITPYIWDLTHMLKEHIDVIENASFDQFRAWRISSVPRWAKNIYYEGDHVFFNE